MATTWLANSSAGLAMDQNCGLIGEYLHAAAQGSRTVADISHDILHMLPQLDVSPPSPTRSNVSSSWSLPDDAESLFDISGDEAEEEYKRKKRQTWVNDLREARLREREREDEEEEQKRVEATRRDESVS